MPDAPTIRQGYKADFTFQVEGMAIDDLKVTAFTGHEAISELFSFRVELCSDNPDIAFEDVVGKACDLEIYGVAGPRYINGLVRRFERLGEGVNLAHYAAEIVPNHWLLTKRHKSRIFQEKSIPDIVAQVLTDSGIPSDQYRLALQNSYSPREFVVQYRESDFHFIARLMEEVGIFFFFEHRADGHVMVIADSDVAHTTVPNAETIPFRDRSGLVPDQNKEVVYSLRERQDVQIGAVALDDFNFEKPATDLLSEQKGSTFTSLQYSDCPGRYVEKAEGDKLSKARIEEFQASRRVQQMEAGVRALMPGYKFTLEEHPVEALNREYVVTRMTHRGLQPQSGQEEADGSRGLEYNTLMETIWSETPFRPARVTPRPTVLGSQTAIVVGPAGEEIYTDKYGRVKVQFHWDREGVYDEKSSCWVRVSQGAAGGGYGMLFLPRVGQEVIVDFLEGDPDRPIITGRVYNADHMPAYTLPDEKTRSYIKTNSSKGGGGTNEIRFEDKKGSEQILIYAQKDHHLNVQDSRVVSVGGADNLNCGSRVTAIGDKYELSVKTDWNTQVDGNLTCKVGGNEGHKIGGNYAVDGNCIYIKGGMKVIIEAGVQVSLKGPGGFVDIGPAGVTIQGTIVKINSGGAAGSGSPVAPVAPGQPAEADTATPGKDVTYSATKTEYEKVTVTQMVDEEETDEAQQEDSWVEFELTDDEGNPVPYELYEVTLPNGKKIRGRLNKDGLVRISGIKPGQCEITFPCIDKEGWRR